MDGIDPGVGPDVDLCHLPPRFIRRAWFVCHITEVFMRCSSKWNKTRLSDFLR
jgi:hypothetical protein